MPRSVRRSALWVSGLLGVACAGPSPTEFWPVEARDPPAAPPPTLGALAVSVVYPRPQQRIDAGDLGPLEGSTYIARIGQIRTDVQTGTPTTPPVGAEDVTLRVYTYKMDPASGPALLAAPVIVEIDA